MTMTLGQWARKVVLAALAIAGSAQAGTLVIESWRVDDKALWETVLIPAFQKKGGQLLLENHPDGGLLASLRLPA